MLAFTPMGPTAFSRRVRSAVAIVFWLSILWVTPEWASAEGIPWHVYQADSRPIEAPTFEAAAVYAFQAYSGICWADGRGGCLSWAFQGCNPSGVPSPSATASSCYIGTSDGFHLAGIAVYGRQDPPGFFLKATPSPQNP